MRHIHVIPIDDLREHSMSIDCWCYPVEGDTVQSKHTGEWGRTIIHNAQDCREKWERQGLKGMAPGWDIVLEDRWIDQT